MPVLQTSAATSHRRGTHVTALSTALVLAAYLPTPASAQAK